MASNNSITAIQAIQPITAYGNKNSQNQAENRHNNLLKPLQNVETPDKPVTTDIKEVNKYISEMNKISITEPPHMKFSIDEDTGHSVVRMTQKDTGELVRQIPSEEFLNIARMILESGEKLSENSGNWIEKDA